MRALPFFQCWTPYFCMTSVLSKLLTNPQHDSFSLAPGDKSFNNPDSGCGPLFAQQPSIWPVWKYRGQPKPLCSGF